MGRRARGEARDQRIRANIINEWPKRRLQYAQWRRQQYGADQSGPGDCRPADQSGDTIRQLVVLRLPIIPKPFCQSKRS